jgi:hypothetical protein
MKQSLFHNTLTRLERSLTCELIASDLHDGGSVKPFSTSDADIIDFAMQFRFTRVPLLGEMPPRDKEISHVAIVDLREGRLIKRRPITADDLIAGETPIGKAIQLLSERAFCFVLVHESIRKILTRSDLNKLPVRAYLGTLLAHLEGVMASLIAAAFPDNAWQPALSASRQQAAHALFDQKKNEDFDTTLLDCTTLSDKSTIIRKSAELFERLDLPSEKEFDRQFEQIKQLRNRLPHNLPPIMEDCDTLRDHVYHGQQLVKAKDVDWLAGVVSTMQGWIDAFAQLPREAPDYGA